MWIAIAIVAVIALAVIGLLVTARSRATTGRLSRETRKRDEAAAGSSVADAAAPADESSVVEEAGEGRARADEARRAIESGGSAVPEPRAASTPAVYEPVDLEELGVTRRQFFNRSLLAGSGLGLGAFGVAVLAFLWPGASTGFGGKVVVGSVADANTAIGAKMPFYNATAKTYIVAYPKVDLPKAKKVSAYTPPIIAGMEAGYVALYQKCVHLGCRVPWCQSSQWFECPCHGSKYNKVGEKVGGPAPRGLAGFVLGMSRGHVRVESEKSVLRPPSARTPSTRARRAALCLTPDRPARPGPSPYEFRTILILINAVASRASSASSRSASSG
jgi:cytochrome b6-f complex iron-sulfur subunit